MRKKFDDFLEFCRRWDVDKWVHLACAQVVAAVSAALVRLLSAVLGLGLPLGACVLSGIAIACVLSVVKECYDLRTTSLFDRQDLLAGLAGVALFGMSMLLCGCDRALKQENERLREELARQQQYVPLQRDTIRDTVVMVTQQVVEVENMKEVLTKDDRQLLKDMDAKIGAIESYQKIGMRTEAAVTLQPAEAPSRTEGDGDAEEKGPSRHQDSILTYHDAWMDLKYHQYKKDFVISFKDSLAISVEREYRKRFLWWKWGVKGYEVKAVSFSPYTTIRYNTFVKRKR